MSPIIAAIVSIAIWQSCNFFLSRKDYYVNSPYSIIKRKIGICIKLGIYALIAMIIFLKAFKE